MSTVKPTYISPTDGSPKPLDPSADAIVAKAVYVQNSTPPDSYVGISRDSGNNLVFTDVVSGSKTLANLITVVNSQTMMTVKGITSSVAHDIDLITDGDYTHNTADSTNIYILPDNSMTVVSAYVLARSALIAQSGVGWRVEGVVRRMAGAGTTAMVGTPSVTVLGSGNGAFGVQLIADSTYGGVKLRAVSSSDVTAYWLADMSFTTR